jgi:hypothetical protein
MGCGDACPIFTCKRYLDWQLDDPAGKSVENVHLVCDEIDSDDVDLRLLDNAMATAAGLYVLILIFGPVSGGTGRGCRATASRL